MSTNVKCFWIEPTGDALVEYKDGRPSAILPYVWGTGDDSPWKLPEYDGWTSIDPRWRRPETGEIKNSTRDFGPGAMFDAYWLHGFRVGEDDRSIMVILPDMVEWFIDGRCNNCTKPEDKIHYCWPRHGEPPNLTVDKNGNTCAAGAGSIMTSKFHGFLRNGELVPC